MRDMVEGYQKPNMHSSTFAPAGSSVRHRNKNVTQLYLNQMFSFEGLLSVTFNEMFNYLSLVIYECFTGFGITLKRGKTM